MTIPNINWNMTPEGTTHAHAENFKRYKVVGTTVYVWSYVHKKWVLSSVPLHELNLIPNPNIPTDSHGTIIQRVIDKYKIIYSDPDTTLHSVSCDGCYQLHAFPTKAIPIITNNLKSKGYTVKEVSPEELSPKKENQEMTNTINEKLPKELLALLSRLGIDPEDVKVVEAMTEEELIEEQIAKLTARKEKLANRENDPDFKVFKHAVELVSKKIDCKGDETLTDSAMTLVSITVKELCKHYNITAK